MFFAQSYDNVRDGGVFWPRALAMMAVASVCFWILFMLSEWVAVGLMDAPDLLGIGVFIGLCVAQFLAARYVLQWWGFKNKYANCASAGLLILGFGELLLVAILSAPSIEEISSVFLGISWATLLGGGWLFIRYFSEGPETIRPTARQLSRRK